MPRRINSQEKWREKCWHWWNYSHPPVGFISDIFVYGRLISKWGVQQHKLSSICITIRCNLNFLELENSKYPHAFDFIVEHTWALSIISAWMPFFLCHDNSLQLCRIHFAHVLYGGVVLSAWNMNEVGICGSYDCDIFNITAKWR